jgi:hypothetical protein
VREREEITLKKRTQELKMLDSKKEKMKAFMGQ